MLAGPLHARTSLLPGNEAGRRAVAAAVAAVAVRR